MIRINVICEGQTEEMFVNEVLSKAFSAKNIFFRPTLIGKPGHKGGNFKFDRLFTDVRALLLGDKIAYCTTFFDFYALPEGFPGKQEAKSETGIRNKAKILLSSLTERLTEKLGEEPLRRFIPYVQMYEFEGLLFSDPAKMAQGITQPSLERQLQKIRDVFATPEDINDSPNTAPSKRIKKLYSAYEKPLYGLLAALEIGLATIRRECQCFDAWLQDIESLQS